MQRRIRIAVLLLAAGVSGLVAQTLTTGDIVGTVSDPSGAVIPNATVVLSSLDTGTTQTAAANMAGQYRFTLLKPGHYMVTASDTGFEKLERTVDVGVGQVATADMILQVGQATQTIEVSGGAPIINPEPATVTNYTAAQVDLLPTAGGDITNIAFTAPGVVVNNTGGYGNFTLNGLPATSNLFTVNGENDMDPYFNINNSGATNLTIGSNELEETSIISNPYGGEYGQLAGAQVTYVTKSGTNDFHGNAIYFWNGRALNANDWFNNATGTPIAFSNQNQWAASLGGPIVKNRTFFFVDNEGIRFVIPNVIPTRIPSPDFASAVLSNIKSKEPSEYAMYQKLFDLWADAPGASNAAPIPNSSECGALNLSGFNPATEPCVLQFQATPTALASEWILAGRVDQNISNNDKAYFRYKMDEGTQPTYLSAISPNFNALSKQPSWDTQVNETHIFGPTASNVFMATLSYYSALFSQDEQKALGTFPYDIITETSVTFGQLGGGVYDTGDVRAFPQGRKITQYQFIDDFTWNRGKHNFKFGENFRRYDVSDHNFTWINPGVYFGLTSDGLQNFADGLAYQYRQADSVSDDVPIAMWGLGLYAQDEWNVTSRLKLTLALRAEHNSNPVCQSNCFANFNTGFYNLASVTSADPASVPYASDIAVNLHYGYPGVDRINWSPRFGFSWSPFADSKTVVSGGFGLFYDSPPAGMVDGPNGPLGNPPVYLMFRVRPTAGVLPFDPAGGAAIFQAASQAFNVNESYSQIASALASLGVSFPAPAFTAIEGTIHSPEWQEWSFQVQRQLSNSLMFDLAYAGNHGVKLLYTNPWPNAYDQYGLYPGVAGVNAAPLAPGYGTVTTIQNGAVSNYNGLTASLRTRVMHGFSADVNYMWSHNLDDASNGGLFTYGDSLLGQLNPYTLAYNYGNSDYDIRNQLTADWVYMPTFHFGSRFLKAAVDGWQLSGKIFWRSGLPYSIVDGNTVLGNYGGTLLGTYVGGAAQPTSCGEANNYVSGTPCLNADAFVNAASATFAGYTSLPNQTRNQSRGPHYFDTDMALFRTFNLTERMKLGIGAQAFNVFNHPNFGLPDNTLGDSTFGQILTMASAPTSPYGAFLNFDSSPRVLQVTGRITF